MTKDQVTEAIKDLITLGMFEKHEWGHLMVIQDVMTFRDIPQNLQVIFPIQGMKRGFGKSQNFLELPNRCYQ